MSLKKRNMVKQFTFYKSNQLSPDNYSIEDGNDPRVDLLYECIEELEEFDRAIALLYLDRKSHKDISQITGLSVTNVGTRISRIKDKLKQLVKSMKS